MTKKHFLIVVGGTSSAFIETTIKIFTQYNMENNIKTINLKIPNTFILEDTNGNFTESELCGIYRRLLIENRETELPKLIKTIDILVKQISDPTLLF